MLHVGAVRNVITTHSRALTSPLGRPTLKIIERTTANDEGGVRRICLPLPLTDRFEANQFEAVLVSKVESSA